MYPLPAIGLSLNAGKRALEVLARTTFFMHLIGSCLYGCEIIATSFKKLFWISVLISKKKLYSFIFREYGTVIMLSGTLCPKLLQSHTLIKSSVVRAWILKPRAKYTGSEQYSNQEQCTQDLNTLIKSSVVRAWILKSRARKKKTITNNTYNFILYNSCSMHNCIKMDNKKIVWNSPLNYYFILV